MLLFSMQNKSISALCQISLTFLLEVYSVLNLNEWFIALLEEKPKFHSWGKLVLSVPYGEYPF